MLGAIFSKWGIIIMAALAVLAYVKVDKIKAVRHAVAEIVAVQELAAARAEIGVANLRREVAEASLAGLRDSIDEADEENARLEAEIATFETSTDVDPSGVVSATVYQRLRNRR